MSQITEVYSIANVGMINHTWVYYYDEAIINQI